MESCFFDWFLQKHAPQVFPNQSRNQGPVSIRAIALLLLLIPLAAMPVSGSVTLSPTADAFTSTANPSGNFGAGGSMAVAAAGLPNGGFDTVMRFDFSTAKTSFDSTFGVGGWTLLNATLQVNMTTSSPNPIYNALAAGSFAVEWMSSDAWTEGTGTPNVPTADGISNTGLLALLASGVQSAGTFNYAGGAGIQNLSLTLTPGMVTDAVNGGQASFHFKPNDAAVSLILNSRTFGTTSFRPTLTLNAIALTALTVQQAWRLQSFGITTNTGNAADTFDFDNDGIPNLIEWTCKLNPTTTSALPISVVRNGANFEYTYTRSVSAVNAGAVFTVEWSDSLAANSWSTAGVSSAILSDNGTVQTVKATMPAGLGGKRFAHLKVTAPP